MQPSLYPAAGILMDGTPMLDTTSPGDPSPDTSHENLSVLLDRCADSASGFATMVNKAEPSFRETATRFHDLHVRHAEALAGMLADLGVQDTSPGTIMGTINQTVVSVRAFFDEIDQFVMDRIRSGEAWVLEAFDAALATETDAERAAALRGMRDEITALLADTQHLG